MAPQHALVRGRGGKKQDRTRRQLSHQIERSSDAFRTNSIPTIPAHQPSRLNTDPETARALRANALVCNGYISRAAKSLTQEGLLPINSATCKALAALHPPASAAVPPLPPDAPSITVDKVELHKLVRDRLCNGSAPGYSGWTGELVRALIDDEECLEGLTVLIEDILNGYLSPAERDYIIPSSTLPASKGPVQPGQTPGLAMREAFYKLAAAYGLSLVNDEVPRACEPFQLAFSRGGSERAVHILQGRLEVGGPDTVIVKTDVRNAFNEIRRSTFMSKLFTMQALGPIWRLTHWAYASQSALYVVDKGALMETLWSREGVQQGDVLGGLLFCLGSQDNYVSSINGAKDVTGVAVMDDFYIQGNYTQVFQPFDRYATESKQDGLILRPDKCIVLWAHPREPPQPLLDEIKKRGLCLAPRCDGKPGFDCGT